MQWRYFVLVVLVGNFVVGCNKHQWPSDNDDQTLNSKQQTSNSYSFPNLEEISSIEYLMQTEQVWHPVASELWPRISDTFSGNKEWQSKLVKGSVPLPPPFAYHLQVRCPNGRTTLLSCYGGENFFCVGDSITDYQFKKSQGELLWKMIENLEKAREKVEDE